MVKIARIIAATQLDLESGHQNHITTNKSIHPDTTAKERTAIYTTLATMLESTVNPKISNTYTTANIVEESNNVNPKNSGSTIKFYCISILICLVLQLVLTY